MHGTLTSVEQLLQLTVVLTALGKLHAARDKSWIAMHLVMAAAQVIKMAAIAWRMRTACHETARRASVDHSTQRLQSSRCLQQVLSISCSHFT